MEPYSGHYCPDPETDCGHVKIGDIALSYRQADGGGTHYRGRVHFEEYLSPLYPLLGKALAPRSCIDIGANYGYTALLMARNFPECHLTLVEPIPWLADYIRHNFAANGQAFDVLHSAIVSTSTPDGRSTFGMRPKATQDSRVILQPGMVEIQTGIVTLDELTANIADDEGVYIKIDTQGWEERVFASGAAFLARHDRWFIKTEFAPAWLESQGSDPVAILADLVSRYDVYESAGRLHWNTGSLSQALGHPLLRGTEADFVRYVRNLGLNDTGWVDLYVLPQTARRGYSLWEPAVLDQTA